MKFTIKAKKINILNELIEAFELAFEDNEVLTLTIGNVRSNSQNSMLHALFQNIGNEIGEMNTELVKEAVKIHLGYVDTLNINGRIIEIPLKTSQMSKEQMSEFIEKVAIFSQDFLNFKQ